METMRLTRIILDIILILLFVALVAVAGYFVYSYYYSDIGISRNIEVNASATAVQFEKNMRFNHNNITYFILECDENKIKRLKEAFAIIENETGMLRFIQIDDKENADIHVGCSAASFEAEKNVFVAGEGGPTEFLNLTLYPVILKGKVILYEKSSCDYPITELHEIFHVFGFDHINNSKYIMYPYVGCKQRIDPDLIKILVNLYSVGPLAELYFVNISAEKNGIYLNFSTQISNEGLKDAENVSLNVYADNEKLDSFDLKIIKFGTGETFQVSNLMLHSANSDKITFIITSETKEFDEKNNIKEVEIL